MKNYIDDILQEIKEDRTTGAVELGKNGVDGIALFMTHFAGDSFLIFFDTTPLDYLRAIVTEEGIVSRIEILRRFKNMKVSKYV